MCRYDESEYSVAISCCGSCGDLTLTSEGLKGTITVPDAPTFTRTEDALQVLVELFEHATETFKRKNKGYADAERTLDVLENFRSEAKRWGVSMLTYAGIMRGKHEKAWHTFVRGGEVPDFPWRILKDRLVYTLIEYLIAIDQNVWWHEEVMQDTKEGS